MGAGSSQPGVVSGDFVPSPLLGLCFPSPSNEINTFTCRRVLRMELGSFAFAFHLLAEQLPLQPPHQPECHLQPPQLSRTSVLSSWGLWWHFGLRTPFPWSHKTCVCGTCAGPSPLCVAGSRGEPDAQLERCGGQIAQARQEEGSLEGTPPGLSTPLTSCGTQPTTLAAQLGAAFVPLGCIQTFPQDPSPLSFEPKGHMGKEERGAGEGGSMFKPVVSAHRRGSPRTRCSSSTGKHSPVCFYVSCLHSQTAPGQPSTEALRWPGPRVSRLHWGGSDPQGNCRLL